MQHSTTCSEPLGTRLPSLVNCPCHSAAHVMTLAVLLSSNAASSSHRCHLQVTRMRMERRRREGRDTSSADPRPPQGPGQPRTASDQVGTLMCLSQATEGLTMPCRVSAWFLPFWRVFVP